MGVIEIVMVVVLALVAGVPLALLVTFAVLSQNIKMGDSKGDFRTYSRFPLRMLSQSTSSVK